MIHVEKPKLSKARSYALKTSMLEAALRDARLGCNVQLVYWTPQRGNSILEAHYWLPNANVPHPRVYVRAGSVPREHRHDAAVALERVGLPRLITWLSRIVGLTVDAPVLASDLYFNFEYCSGRAT